VRERGKFALDKRHLTPSLYRFHFTLQASSMGAWLMGIVALVWFLDCFVGAYLTFPRGRPLSSGLRYLRAIENPGSFLYRLNSVYEKGIELT
jgi:uncharacterized iron-regulated membrane protein